MGGSPWRPALPAPLRGLARRSQRGPASASCGAGRCGACCGHGAVGAVRLGGAGHASLRAAAGKRVTALPRLSGGVCYWSQLGFGFSGVI